MTGDAWLDLSPSPAPLLHGLARNPAAPVSLLLRLLDTHPEKVCAGLRWRHDLPAVVQDAMLRHPSPRIRGALAAHPQVDPQVRVALLADPEWRVRVRAFGRPGQRPLPDDVLVRLLTDLDDGPADAPFTREELLGELLYETGVDLRLIRLAAAHPRPGVRRYAAGFLDTLDEPTRGSLLEDEAPEVMQAAADYVAYRQRVMEPADLPDTHGHTFWQVLHRPLSRALVDQVVAGGDTDAIAGLAVNPTVPPDVVQTLVGHPDPAIRRRVAERPDLTGEQLIRLAGDMAAEVRTAISTHPGLTEQQRAGIDIDVTTAPGHGHYGTCDGCRATASRHEPPPQPGDSLRWARSVNPLLRRRAARDAQLPAELAAILADDSDLGVRVLLAQHHPAAPPELLLRCYLESRCGRERLTELPRFPTDGLARFAGDADPAVRRLLALDPHAEPMLVDRLTADPDATVRQAMANCPRLPVPRIIALLGDPALAEAAAANPALPVDQMQEIVDRG